MACVLRDDVCADSAGVLVCAPYESALTGALHEVPALLDLLSVQAGRSLARPLADVPSRGTAEPTEPARLHLIDLSERLTDAVAEWAAVTGRPRPAPCLEWPSPARGWPPP